MHLSRFLQPITGQAGDVLRAELRAKRGADEATAILVSAWAKLSGLARLWSDLQSFVEAGGLVTVVVGIDQRGTSREALERLLQLTADSYVFHDESMRSFHPKYYVVANAKGATALTGSGNLTKGGLFTNYELFDVMDLDLSDERDIEWLRQIRDEVRELTSDEETCKQLTAELIASLVDDGRVMDERYSSAIDESTVEGRRGPRRSIFGSRFGLPGAPPPEFPIPGVVTERRRRGTKRGPPRTSKEQRRHRAFVDLSRGRPGQLQLRKEVFDWIVGSRQQLDLVDGVGNQVTTGVVLTHARGGVNTRRLEVPGLDQNARDRFLLLEQEQGGAVRYETISPSDPRLAELPPSKSTRKAFVLQEEDSGTWKTVSRSPA